MSKTTDVSSELEVLGQQLKIMRLERGEKIEQVALRLSISPSVLERLETGHHAYCSLDIFNRLCQYYGKDPWKTILTPFLS